MTDNMRWFYDEHLRPYIEAQAKDSGELYHFSFLEPALTTEEQKDVAAVNAFYAVHGFRLGLRLGLTLSDELRDKEPV